MSGEGEVVEDRGDTLADGAPALVDAPLADPLADDKDEPKDEPKGDDDEDDADGDAKEDPKSRKKDSRIPLARHKEMLDKARGEREALAAENARLKAAAAGQAVAADLDKIETRLIAMETEYSKLLADGEIDKATAKMAEIRRLERSIGEQKATLQAEQAEARAVERVRYDTVVERVEQAYPAMNPDHEEFDADAVAEVLDVKGAFEAKGATPSAALQRAVKYVLGAASARERTAVEVTPRVDKDAAVSAAAEQRKGEALKRNIAAAKATPAALGKVGVNSDEKGGSLTSETAMKMSQDEFAKLDEKTLARLRGDEL
jgi:hypothetical protein